MKHKNDDQGPLLTREDFENFITTNTAIASPHLVPEVKLYLASDITPLWQASEKMFESRHVPAPFWSFAWPGGQALSRYILDNPEWVKGKRVIDVASGSGMGAFAAKIAGAASIKANDIDPVALAAIGLNAKLNNMEVETIPTSLINQFPEDTDVLLVGDFFYEWPTAGYALEWLRACVAENITVLLADPGRPHVPRSGIKELARYTMPTSKAVEDATEKTALIYQLLAEEE